MFTLVITTLENGPSVFNCKNIEEIEIHIEMTDMSETITGISALKDLRKKEE